MSLTRRRFIRSATGGLIASTLLPGWRSTDSLLARALGSDEPMSLRQGKKTGTFDLLLNGRPLVEGAFLSLETEQGVLRSTDTRFLMTFQTEGDKTSLRCHDARSEIGLECTFIATGSILVFQPAVRNTTALSLRLKNLYPLIARSSDGGSLFFGDKKTRVLTDEWERCYGSSGVVALPESKELLSAWDIHLFDEDGGTTLTLSYYDTPNAKLSFSVAPRAEDASLDLIVRADLHAGQRGLLLPPGGTFTLGRLMLAHVKGSVHQWLERYAREIAGQNSLPPVGTIPTGWVDWYFSFSKTTEEDVLKNLDFLARELKEYGLEYVQIDSGWQLGVETAPPPHNAVAGGPWTENQKFRKGMKWFADQIRSRGLKPGIWVRPFQFIEGAPERTEHPEWFNGRGQMDFTRPEVRSLVRGLFSKLVNEWGFEYIKYDFVAYDLFGEFGMKAFADVAAQAEPDDQTRTNIQAYREMLEEIRAASGTKAKILACNSIMPPTLGEADSFRIGDDVGNWQRTFTYGVKSVGARYYTNGVFWANDPDCLLVREPFTLDQARMWGSLIALSGGIVFISENLATLPADRLDIIKKCLPVYQNPGDGYRFGRPLDLLENNPATIWHLPVRRAFGSWDVIGLFNWTDSSRPVRVDLTSAGFRPQEDLLAFDFWNQTPLGTLRGNLTLDLPPLTCRVLSLHRKLDRPQLLSTSRHITQGGVECVGLEWDPEARILSGRHRVIGGNPYVLFLHVPDGYTLSRVEGAEREPGGVRNHHILSIGSASTDVVPWQAEFRG